MRPENKELIEDFYKIKEKKRAKRVHNLTKYAIYTGVPLMLLLAILNFPAWTSYATISLLLCIIWILIRNDT